METHIQVFAALNLFIIGISHLVRPQVWIRFFLRLFDRGEEGVFVIGFMSLIFGSLIVGFHPVWSGMPLVLTLFGCSQVLKACLYFTFPSWGLKQRRHLSVERPRPMRVAGLFLMAVAGWLGVHVLGTVTAW